MSVVSQASQPQLTAIDIIGPHPQAPHFFGEWLQAKDAQEANKICHRALIVKPEQALDPAPQIRQYIIKHHASEEQLKRLNAKKEALKKQGYAQLAEKLKAFPLSGITRKGNAAEIILAEYLASQPGVEIPVYRLQYNPNVEQSMKGDDVLAFDFTKEPVRLIVGESKFRGTPAAVAVNDMGNSLSKSHQSGLPASLEFVADRLYEKGETQLADRVSRCTFLFAEGKLQLSYAGLLVSNTRAAEYVTKAGSIELERLVVISLGIDQPDAFIDNCYKGL
jgi:hypothetical protein